MKQNNQTLHRMAIGINTTTMRLTSCLKYSVGLILCIIRSQEPYLLCFLLQKESRKYKVTPGVNN